MLLLKYLEPNLGSDGGVRRVELRYKNHSIGKNPREYKTASDIVITRKMFRE